MQEKPQKKTVRREEESGLPLSVNPFIINSRKRKPAVHYSSGDLISGIMSGDRILLSQAITLSESTLKEHREIIMEVIEGCIPYSGKSIRVGISGIPGVGKSTFIETLGSIVTDEGRKLAVLAVDPSSTVSKGSIMGDKIRMEKMSIHPDVFIRPSLQPAFRRRCGKDWRSRYNVRSSRF
jgi:LAO/AO transport system kinase